MIPQIIEELYQEAPIICGIVDPLTRTNYSSVLTETLYIGYITVSRHTLECLQQEDGFWGP